MGRSALFALAIAVVSVLLFGSGRFADTMPGASAAHRVAGFPPDQIRPHSHVRSARRWRGLQRQYADWAFPSPPPRSGCSHLNEDAPGVPPTAYPKDPGRKRLTFRYSGLPERPRVIKVSMWRSVAADGSPQGRSQRLRTRRLRRVGHKRWTFRVRADLTAERFFFVYGRWPRNDGCGPRQVGDTLRTRPR